MVSSDIIATQSISWWKKFIRVGFPTKQSRPRFQPRASWCRPPLNFLKVNVDNAYSESSNLGGVAVIVRNDSGDFVTTTSVRMTSIPYPLLIEAMVARAGLLLARQKGFQNFILECDSLKIVATLRDSSAFLSDVGIVVEDSRELMASITGVSCTHVRHQANGIAHRLARAALHSKSSCCWFKEPPDLILDLLIKESGL